MKIIDTIKTANSISRDLFRCADKRLSEFSEYEPMLRTKPKEMVFPKVKTFLSGAVSDLHQAKFHEYDSNFNLRLIDIEIDKIRNIIESFDPNTGD